MIDSELDISDDIALLPHNQQQMQGKLTQVESREAETGIIISTEKTKEFTISKTMHGNLNVNSTALEEFLPT